jgi:hypothetical protein
MRVVALVFFDKGSQGFEENFDQETSVEEYIQYFESKTKDMNGTLTANLYYIEKSVHDADGSFIMNENGDRVMERIYQNDNLHKAIFNI